MDYELPHVICPTVGITRAPASARATNLCQRSH